MVFPFTFNFSVPGILNPFGKVSPPSNPSAPTSPEQKHHSRNYQSPTDSCQTVPKRRSQAVYEDRDPAPDYPSPAYPTSRSYPIPIASPSSNRLSRAHLPKIERRRSPSPSPSSLRALPLSRKRRWEPTFGAESIQSLTGNGKTSSTTSLTLASSSGYLDTPAKYRDMAEDITMSDDNYRDNEQTQDDEDAPPLKKRRGLAGSIVSTAVSAALIGTAVGLTVYRLWRDRGKEGQLAHPVSASASGPSTPDVDQQMPPPPYDPGAWKAIDQPPAVPVSASASAGQSRSNQSGTQRSAKSKKVVASSKRPVGGSHHHHYSSTGSTRRPRARYVAGGGGGVVGSPRTRPEFDFGRAEVDDVGGEGVEQTEVEDKMDWIGDKLGMLIEQGRRALQSEVVVMSEAQEDEVDDGRGGWEEDSSADEDGDARSVNGQSPARSIRSRSGSVRAKGSRAQAPPRNIVPPSSGVGLGLYDPRPSGSLSASPRRAGFAPSAPGTAYGSPSTSYTPVAAAFVPSSAPSAMSGMGMGRHVRGASYESALPVSGSGSGFGFGSEDSAAWESPELRESMERARARLLAARRGGAAGS